MRKLLSLALAATALAVPASASGAEFTHGGNPIEEEIHFLLKGQSQMFVAGGGASITCASTTLVHEIDSPTTGKITSYTPGHCTTNEGLPAHVTPVGLPWEVHVREQHVENIIGTHLHASVRHPSTTHLEVATIDLNGDAFAVFSTFLDPATWVFGSTTGKLLINGSVHAGAAGGFVVTNTANQFTAVNIKE